MEMYILLAIFIPTHYFFKPDYYLTLEFYDQVNPLNSMYIAKYSQNGAFELAINMGNSKVDYFNEHIAFDSIGNLYVASSFCNNTLYFNEIPYLSKRNAFIPSGTISENFILKFGFESLNVNEDYSKTSFSIYPNPTSEAIKISYMMDKSGESSIMLYNELGELIKVLACGYLESGNHEENFDLSDIPSGAYMVIIKSGSGAQSERISIIK